MRKDLDTMKDCDILFYGWKSFCKQMRSCNWDKWILYDIFMVCGPGPGGQWWAECEIYVNILCSKQFGQSFKIDCIACLHVSPWTPIHIHIYNFILICIHLYIIYYTCLSISIYLSPIYQCIYLCLCMYVRICVTISIYVSIVYYLSINVTIIYLFIVYLSLSILISRLCPHYFALYLNFLLTVQPWETFYII